MPFGILPLSSGGKLFMKEGRRVKRKEGRKREKRKKVFERDSLEDEP